MTETATLEPPAPAATAPEPYKGLRPYEEGDQDLFFGRDAERNVLVDKILTHRLTLLFAATGVGKSSLLQAAVLPRLKDPRQENLEVVDYNDWVTPPLAGLKERTLEVLKDRGYLADDAPLEGVAELELREFFRFAALFGRPPLVVVLDQFEEFFRYQRKTDQFEPFVRQLAAAVADREAPVAFVLSMREDFALELNAFKPYLSGLLFENFYRLEKLRPESAEEAIVKPVERFGFRYEDELLEALRKDLAERDETGRFTTPLAGWVDTVEPPYLQIVCSQLWELEKDNPEKTLRLATYRDRVGAEGLLRSYVHRVLGRFSAEEKRLASLAFNYLVTRHGTKMAYTAGELARTVAMDPQAMAAVLEKLHRARILRSQQRKDVLWYELYHDLFSGIIGEWNDAYKTRQRYRRAAIFAGIFLVAGFMLFAAYDVTRNLVERHFRMSLRPVGSETIDLYRGEAQSLDLLSLQKFETETQIRRAQVEPDKLFRARPVGDFDLLSEELIAHLPSEKRVRAYWEAGLVKKALRLANSSISEDDLPRAKQIILNLVSLGSLEVVDLLNGRLAEEGTYLLKAELIRSLGSARIPEAADGLVEALQAGDATVRLEAATTLAPQRPTKALETMLELINHPDRNLRVSAAKALGELGSREAVAPLIEYLKNPHREMRIAAVSALGRLGSREAVAPVIKCLDDSDWDVRQHAAAALGHLGSPDAVAPLIELLNDRDNGVRIAAAQALGRLGSPEAVAALIHALNDPDDDVRHSAAVALPRSKAVGPLILRLYHPDSQVRERAASALGYLGSNVAVVRLIEILNDPDNNVRNTAVWELAQLGSVQAVPALIERLDDPSSHVRQQTAKALGRLGTPEAVAALKKRLNHPDADLRSSAAMMLAQLGIQAAVAPLIEFLNDPDQLQNAFWSISALQTFEEVDYPEAVAVLIKQLNEPESSLRENAAYVLGRLGSAEAVAPLTQRLNDPDSGVRSSAAWALGQLGSAEAVSPLMKRFSDPDSEVRASAAAALGYLGSSETVALLIERLNDPESKVRTNATGALGQLGSPQALSPLVELIDALGETASSETSSWFEDDSTTERRYAEWALGQLLPDGSRPSDQVATAERVTALIERLDIASWSSRRYAVIALGRIGDRRAIEPLSAVLGDPSEIRTVKLAAAASLLALGSEEGLPLLTSTVNSPLVAGRREVVDCVTELSVEQSFELLAPLLDDEVFSIKIGALRALRHTEPSQALAHLHPKLEDPDLRIRKPAAEAVAVLASPESVRPIRTALAKNPTDAAVNLTLLEALGKIGTPEAVEALLEAVRQNEKDLGLRAYKVLGDVRADKALPWFDKRLDRLVKDTREWRRIRDSEREDFSQEEADAWTAKLDEAKPDWHWAFVLGNAIARIDPEKRGVELLSHELADVRYGAWMGLGEVGSVDLLRRLDAERDENRTYPFRDAAYRAIDHILRRLEVTATEGDLRALRELLPEVRDKKAVCTRVEWTIRVLDKESPRPDGHCQINWRQPTS